MLENLMTLTLTEKIPNAYTRKLDLLAYVNRRQVRQTPSMLNFVELRILTSPPSIIHINATRKKYLHRQSDGAVLAFGGLQLSPTETKPEKKYYSTEYVKLPDRKKYHNRNPLLNSQQDTQSLSLVASVFSKRLTSRHPYVCRNPD